MDLLTQLNAKISQVVWGPAMLALMLGAGVYLSLRCGFFQFTHFGRMLRTAFGGMVRHGQGKNGISPLQAMSTALAGTMGVGNITGVATALALGGPGAVFWMWISALFGMMTKFAEVSLAVRFRAATRDGKHCGGPMFYLSKGLHAPFLASAFALLCVCASFGIGNLTQANAVSGALYSAFSLPLWVAGIATALLVGLVIVGGLRRIASVTEVTVPFMSALYILGALVVLFQNRALLPQALHDIFSSAFSPAPALGGGAGYTVARALHYGVARGVFSNEAGLGSAPIAHAAADTDSPVTQGLWGMFEVFADTLVCCTLTALVLLTSGVLNTPLEGAAATSAAFAQGLGAFGGVFVSISLVFFAVSSMLGWCYYGEAALQYLTRQSRFATLLYRYLFLLCIPIGAVARLHTVWEFSDTLNGLMAIPNLIGILGLTGVVAKMIQEERKPQSKKKVLRKRALK